MKKLIPTVIVLGVAAAVFIAWRIADDRENAAALRLYGNVDIREVGLGFRVPGRLEEMVFEEGEAVDAGTTLARLDDEPFREELAIAEGALARAQAELAKLRAGSRPQEVRRAEAGVAEAKAALANAESVLERQRRLMADGAGSQRALDQALAEQQAAAARLEAAQGTLDLATEGFRNEDIAAAEAAVLAETARVRQAQTRLADTVLEAPSGGVILTRAREPGTVLGTGAPVYTLSLQEPVWVRAYVDEPDLGRVHPGKPAWVRTDTGERYYRGQVGFISPRAEFTPKTVQTESLRTSLVYRLRIVVEDADESLRQGMPVTVTFEEPAQGS